jgi:hypothetical protein
LPQVWETMIEPDWSITMHMWPMPEPRHPPLGPGVGMDRPRSRHEHGRHRPAVPPMAHRGPLAPPPPPLWPGGTRPGQGPGPGSTPLVVSVPPPKSSGRRKNEPAKGVLGWMAGKPSKSSSGKGTSFQTQSGRHINTNSTQVQKKLNNTQLVSSCECLLSTWLHPTCFHLNNSGLNRLKKGIPFSSQREKRNRLGDTDYPLLDPNT